MTIDEMIAEVQRLDRIATPGPWETDGTEVFDLPGETYLLEAKETNKKWLPDTELIATYRTAAPALAAEVERLRGFIAAIPCNLCQGRRGGCGRCIGTGKAYPEGAP